MNGVRVRVGFVFCMWDSNYGTRALAGRPLFVCRGLNMDCIYSVFILNANKRYTLDAKVGAPQNKWSLAMSFDHIDEDIDMSKFD